MFQPIFTAGFDPYEFTMLIFNRYGELVFETNNAEIGWNGTFGGEVMSDGMYVYKIDFIEKENNKPHSISGHLMLLK